MLPVGESVPGHGAGRRGGQRSRHDPGSARKVVHVAVRLQRADQRRRQRPQLRRQGGKQHFQYLIYV